MARGKQGLGSFTPEDFLFPLVQNVSKTIITENGPVAVDPGMAVSEICRKFNVQNCHVCDDFGCSDNLNKERYNGPNKD